MDESDRKMKQILNDIPDMLLDGNYTPNLKQAIETLKSLASVMLRNWYKSTFFILLVLKSNYSYLY